MWVCSSTDLQLQGACHHHLLLRAMYCLSSSSASKVSRFGLLIQQKYQPVKHRSVELFAGLARGKKEGVRQTLWVAASHLVSSAIKQHICEGRAMFLRPVPVRVHFALLLHVWLVFSLSRKTTSLLEQRTSRFLPDLLGCCCLERSAPLPGSVSRDLLPSPLLRKVDELVSSSFWQPCAPWAFLCP